MLHRKSYHRSGRPRTDVAGSERPVKWKQFRPSGGSRRSRLVRAVIELMREHRQIAHRADRGAAAHDGRL